MMLPWQTRPRQLNSPRDLPGLALWLDANDIGSLRNDSGSVPATGEGIKLMADKSGNSAVNVLCLNKVAGNYATTGNIVYPTTQIEYEWSGSHATWAATGGANEMLVAKDNGTNIRVARLILTQTGNIQLQLSVDGTNLVTGQSSAVAPFSAFQRGYIKATWRASDGRVQFFTSTDGETWTQLGTDQAIAIASIYVGTYNTDIGTTSAGISQVYNGNIFYVKIRSTIGGADLLNVDFSTAAKLATSFVCTTGQTVTINTSGATGCRISGARDLYQGTAANQPILTLAALGNYLTFDGSNDYLKAAAFSLSQPETVYFVGSQVTWTGGEALIDGNADLTGSNIFQNGAGVSPSLRATADGSNFFGTTSGLALNTPGVLSGVFNGVSSALRVNRNAAVTGSGGTTAANGFTLGARGAGTSSFANITASEVLVYAAAHDRATQDRVIQYLARRNRIAA